MADNGYSSENTSGDASVWPALVWCKCASCGATYKAEAVGTRKYRPSTSLVVSVAGHVCVCGASCDPFLAYAHRLWRVTPGEMAPGAVADTPGAGGAGEGAPRHDPAPDPAGLSRPPWPRLATSSYRPPADPVAIDPPVLRALTDLSDRIEELETSSSSALNPYGAAELGAVWSVRRHQIGERPSLTPTELWAGEGWGSAGRPTWPVYVAAWLDALDLRLASALEAQHDRDQARSDWDESVAAQIRDATEAQSRYLDRRISDERATNARSLAALQRTIAGISERLREAELQLVRVESNHAEEIEALRARLDAIEEDAPPARLTGGEVGYLVTMARSPGRAGLYSQDHAPGLIRAGFARKLEAASPAPLVELTAAGMAAASLVVQL